MKKLKHLKKKVGPHSGDTSSSSTSSEERWNKDQLISSLKETNSSLKDKNDKL